MDFLSLDLLPFLLVALPSAVFWVVVFLMFKRSDKLLGLATFIVGCSSIVPIRLYADFFGYESQLTPAERIELGLGRGAYWNDWINFQFAENPLLGYFVQFVFMFATIAIFIFLTAIIAGVVWSLFYFFVRIIKGASVTGKGREMSEMLGLLWVKIKIRFGYFKVFWGETADSVKVFFSEMSHFTFLGIFAGIAVIFSSFFGQAVSAVLLTTFLFAGMEEYSKHLIVRFVGDGRFKNIADAIIYSCLVGVAFAFVENGLYFQSVWGTDSFMGTVIARSLLLVLAHATFSGYFGYYYGVGHFANSLLLERMIRDPKKAHKKSLIRKLKIKMETRWREKKMLTGLILATLIHLVFNLLMQANMAGYAFVLTFGCSGILMLMILKRKNMRRYDLIGTKWMPNKIEYLKTLDAIRDAKTKSGIDPNSDEELVER